MAMSKLLAVNLGKSKTKSDKVISELAAKASPVAKETRNGASSRRKKGGK